MRVLHLVRHGEAAPRDEADKDDPGLTPRGRRQARITATALRGVPFAAIHCSTARRAKETATYLAERHPTLNLRKTKALLEGIPIVPQDQLPIFQAHGIEPDSPHVTACALRLDGAFERFFRPTGRGERHELIVCHGNAIRYLVCRALHIDPCCWTGFRIHNCGVTRIVLGTRFGRGPAVAVIEAFNESSHLPPLLRTM